MNTALQQQPGDTLILGLDLTHPLSEQAKAMVWLQASAGTHGFRVRQCVMVFRAVKIWTELGILEMLVI